jgi:hypothetical protein
VRAFFQGLASLDTFLGRIAAACHSDALRVHIQVTMDQIPVHEKECRGDLDIINFDKN